MIYYANSLNRMASTEQPSDQLDVIDRQVSHLNLLIEDLLDVSRVARGKIRLNRQHVDASSIIPGAIEKARPLITSRKHTLELDVSSEPMPLFVDPARIEQVMANLLTNAAKYTPDGGHICVTAKPAGDSAILAVRDNGIGIAPEMLSRVFDLFVQGEAGRDRDEGGLGIGLALVRKISEMHGGSVRVEERRQKPRQRICDLAAARATGRGTFSGRAVVGLFEADLPFFAECAPQLVSTQRDSRLDLNLGRWQRLICSSQKSLAMKRPSRRTIYAYFCAAVGIAAATEIRYLLNPELGEHLIFSMYYLAVSLAGWAGGLTPALGHRIGSSVLANYLFTEPRGMLQIKSAEDLWALVLFVVCQSRHRNSVGDFAARRRPAPARPSNRKMIFWRFSPTSCATRSRSFITPTLPKTARSSKDNRTVRKSSIGRCSSSIR